MTAPYQEAVGVGVEGKGGREAGEAGEGVGARALLHVPHAHGTVSAARGQQPPRGVHGHAVDEPLLRLADGQATHGQEHGRATVCRR